MAWSVLQSVSGGNSNPISITMTSSLTSGSKLLAFYGDATSTAGLTWTIDDGNSNSFGQIFAHTTTIGTDSVYSGLFALDTPAGDVGTKPSIKMHPSSASTSYFGFVLEVAGLATGQTSAILDGTEGISSWSSASTATDPTYSSSASNNFLVQYLNDNFTSLGPGSYTAPTGYTSSTKLESTAFGSGGIAWKNSTGGSEAGADWTFSSATSAVLLKFAIKLAGGGGAAPPVPARPKIWIPTYRASAF